MGQRHQLFMGERSVYFTFLTQLTPTSLFSLILFIIHKCLSSAISDDEKCEMELGKVVVVEKICLFEKLSPFIFTPSLLNGK